MENEAYVFKEKHKKIWKVSIYKAGFEPVILRRDRKKQD